MKHPIKRLLAGLLAAFMLPTVNLSAFAAGELSANGYTSTQSGDIHSEGVMPDNVIQVITPTARADMFNFILDPNSLIRRSNAARYGGATFGPGNLFFKNVDDGEVSYSMNSDELKVVNKSTCPVNVELTVNVSKGSSDFEFARTTDFKNAKGNKITKRALYLALVNGVRSSPVISVTENSVTTHTAKLRGWIEDPEAYEIGWSAAQNRYAYFLKSGIEDEDLPYTSYYMTGAINSANWDDVGEITFSVTWSLTKEEGPEENPIPDEDTDPTVLVAEPIKAINDVAIMNFDWGWGTKEMARVKEFVYTNSSGRETTVAAASVNDVPIPDKDDDDSPVFVVNDARKLMYVKGVTAIFRCELKDWKVRFEDIDRLHTVDIPVDVRRVTTNANPKVTLKTGTNLATAAGQKVEFTFDYGGGDKAMSKITGFTYLTASGASQTLALDSEYVEMNLEEKTFAITAFQKIYEGSNWKLEYADDENGYYAAPFTIRTQAVTNKKPAVTVTKQASSMYEATSENDRGIVTMTYNLGSGREYATSLYALQYKGADGEIATMLPNASTFVAADGEITLKAIRSVYAGSEWKVVFVNEDSANPVYVNIPVSILATPHDPLPTDTDPSVSVTTPAMDVDETVRLTASFGYGALLKTKIANLTYTDKNGEFQTVPLGKNNLTVSGSTVTFTAVRDIYLGSDWALTFTDDAGKNPYSASFQMKGAGAVEDIDAGPSVVTVDTPAVRVGQEVSLTVNFGRGLGVRNKITALKYDRGGVTNTVLASAINLTVTGTTVTFDAIRSVYAGSDWKLVFTDANGANESEAPFKLLGANAEVLRDRDPSVTVQTAAEHLDDEVVLKLDFGEGDFARTKVTGISYTNLKGRPVTFSAVEVTGNSATFKAEKTLYSGSDWKLLFADDEGANVTPVAFELKGPNPDPIPLEEGVPNVTINAEAVQTGSVVNMSISLGEYTDLQFSEMLYVMNGKVTDTSIVLDTSNMDDVSFTVTKAILNGSQWRLIFSSADHKQSAVVPVNLKTADTFYGVVVTVNKTIAATGDIGEFTIDFGESGYTSVTSLSYVMSGKTAQTTVYVTQMSEDPVMVSLLATKAILNGSKWGLLATTPAGTSLKIPVFVKG